MKIQYTKRPKRVITITQEKPPSNFIWKGNSGSYRVGDMDTGHIQNCIITLKKKEEDAATYGVGEFFFNGMSAGDWVDVFMAELYNREVV